MGFFRLGKLDRSRTANAESNEASPSSVDAPSSVASGTAASSSAAAAAPSAAAAGEPTKDRKKNRRDGDGDALSRTPAASSVPAAVPSAGSSAATVPSTETRAGAGMVARAQAGLSVNDFISKTKNQQRQGLKPSGPELIAYARYLGIDPVADHDLLWIAVEALEAPLPSDWTEHFDSNDRVFYYNATTRVSSWTHPLEHVYRETYKTIVNFRNATMAPQERLEKLQQLQQEVKQMETDVQKEIAQWTEHTDDQGNRFYFNRQERQSTWTDPRPAKCQVLYLRMKMVRLLQSSAAGTQGFADIKPDRMAPLHTGGDGDSAAMKRPTAGASSRAEAGQRVGAGALGGVVHGNDISLGPTPAAAGALSLPESGAAFGSDAGSANVSDSESEADYDGKKKKKKDKKKKKKRKDQDEAPVRLGPAQNLRNSRSEPDVTARPLAAGAVGNDEVRGVGGSGQTLGHGAAFEEGLSNVGRARVKAGIRLEPLGLGPVGGGSSPSNHPEFSGVSQAAGKGVRVSSSVPLLRDTS